jgi:hypothetical protein
MVDPLKEWSARYCHSALSRAKAPFRRREMVPRPKPAVPGSRVQKMSLWSCLICLSWRFETPEAVLTFMPTGKTKGLGDMIQHSRASILKASLFIAGGLAFFLVVMHQAAQLFR